MLSRNQTRNGEALLVSGSYFPTLGVQPALGRLLTPADDQTVGGHYVTVLSHRLLMAPEAAGVSRREIVEDALERVPAL